jgi:CheY-like chemotaxis protein
MEKQQIMIVEDEVLIAAELEQQLLSFGYRVCALATSGEKALALVETMTPDLILMDIKLKGDLDGIETAGRILTTRRIPVVFLTAFADESLLEKAKLSQPFGYLIKPVDSRELHSTIAMALYKAKIDGEKEQLIAELKAALTENKILRGFLPICGHCKKIRDDQGYWQQLEKYITDHSQALFSHGICPECVGKLYPDLDCD